MLFNYTYVPHQMERMQRFINFIFFQVWCRAPKAGNYSLSLYDDHPPLKEVMESFAYDHTIEGDLFSSRIQAIYERFSNLPRADIVQFKRWYQSNNDIERACGNAPGSQIIRYKEICAKYSELCELLEVFFKNLYSDKLLELKALREKIGEIDDHYRVFMAVNSTGKCPFCGISDMLGVYHTKREAYDHYLPKGLYPFNSINLRNLVPACHHCNSNYKTTKDPTYAPKDPAGGMNRRKAFFPYAPAGNNIEITIDMGTADIGRLTPADIQLTFGPSTVQEEIATWRDVYSIDERYKAKCCSNDAKDWLEQIRIFRDTHGLHPEASLATLQQQAEIAPVANCNFLRMAFLEACQRLGIFNVMT